MRTNATIITITRPFADPEPHAIRCLFTGSTLVDQGGTAAKLTGTLVIPHHELVRDTPSPPHSYPKVGDTVTLRLDSRVPIEFGDDIHYVVDSARGVPGGPLKHWHFTLKSP